MYMYLWVKVDSDQVTGLSLLSDQQRLLQVGLGHCIYSLHPLSIDLTLIAGGGNMYMHTVYMHVYICTCKYIVQSGLRGVIIDLYFVVK